MQTAIKDIVVSHLTAVKDGISKRMAQQGRNASGRTLASLIVNASDTGGYLEGSKTFLYLEHGRGPGKVPMGFYDIIRDWVVAKGISYQDMIPKNGTPEQGLRRLSGAIAHTIIEKGTRLYQSKGYDAIFSELLEEELQKLADEAAGVIEIEADKINQEPFDEEQSNTK